MLVVTVDEVYTLWRKIFFAGQEQEIYEDTISMTDSLP